MDRYSRIDQIGERFAADTRDHQLTVLHDEGVYRHIQLRQLGDSFAVTTWPHHLAVTGDRGDWVFSRRSAADMLNLFVCGVTPYSWAHRVVAGEVWEFSAGWFEDWVAEQIAAGMAEDRRLQELMAREGTAGTLHDWDDIRQGITNAVLADATDMHTALEAITDWNELSGPNTGFYFELTELDTRDWEDVTDGFVWACFGIAEICLRRYEGWWQEGGSR